MELTSLMANFRQALVSIVPAVEFVGLPWRRPDAYDEWDTIAATLFDKLVREPIQWSLSVSGQQRHEVQPYDVLLPTFNELGTLEVFHPSLTKARWVFNAFSSKESPFDTIELRAVLEDGKVVTGDLVSCSLDGANFILRITDEDNEPQILRELRWR